MPTPYPVLGQNDSNNLYTLFQYVNNGVGGVFMPFVLLAIWVIVFIGVLSEGRSASRAFIFASFIGSFLAILLSLIGMLSPQYMYFSFLLVAAGVIWYKLESAPGL